VPTSLTPAERSMRARVAAHCKHALHNPVAGTEPARKVFQDSFRLRVIEAMTTGEELSEAEVDRRAEQLKKAHYARLALKSAQARRRRKAS
jgi:hypothetical protein